MTEPLLENPTPTEVFRLAMEAVHTELCVAMPGVVTAYDEDTHLATVLPLLKTRTRTEARAVDLAPIPRVPVIHPRTAKAAIVLPVAAGDPVTLIFSDRALDRWKSGDAAAPVEPETGRKHSLSDCWAIPGGYPEGKPLSPNNPGALDVILAPGTKVAVGNGTDELLELLDGFVDLFELTVTGLFTTYQTHGHGSAGAGPPSDAAGWATALAKLTALRAQLGNLKA